MRRDLMVYRALLVASVIVAQLFAPAAAQQAAAPVNSPVKDKWALVVGISEFAHPTLNLKYAAKDATDFRDFLLSQCNFAPDHVRLITNKQATASRILDELGDAWLPRVAMPDDLVLVFISSHGSPSNMDVAGVNYVIAHDTNPEKLFTTGLPLQTLANTIKERIHCNRVVVVLDTCHSGAASGESKGLVRPSNVDAAALAAGTGQLVICSSSKNESSWESKQYQNSVFTHTLIDALKKNGQNTKLGDALSYLKEEVPRQVLAERATMQTPVISTSKWSGADVVLAAKPASPRRGLPEPPPTQETAPSAVSPSGTPATPVTPAAMAAPVSTSAPSAPPASAANSIPDVAGAWLGSNGVVYHIWQKGRSTGWEMPEWNEYGRGTISEDGKTSKGSWYGPITGHGTSKLEVDANNRVIKMINDDGTSFTRIEGADRRN